MNRYFRNGRKNKNEFICISNFRGNKSIKIDIMGANGRFTLEEATQIEKRIHDTISAVHKSIFKQINKNEKNEKNRS